jgi:stalled ribosome rescue protein Dom34
MNTRLDDLFDRLGRVEIVDVPAGEAGAPMHDEMGATHQCMPVLSAYLDVRPLLSGDQPTVRASRAVLRQRLHQIAETFWPRGKAYEAVLADTKRIEAYLDSAVAAATHGVAIFAGDAQHLFETLTSDVPFENNVSALAMPDLFQLADLLTDREVAVVALAHTHAVRLLVTHRGGMREVRRLAEDPKFFHQVRSTNAMNQAHYQRHARQVRADFAHEVATEIERLVQRTAATEVILGGDAVAIPILRQALLPQSARLLKERTIPMELEMPQDAIWEEIEPLLTQAQESHERTITEQLVEAIQADALGVAGYAPTRTALEAGQADVLVIAKSAPISPEARNELIALAARIDAQVEVIDQATALDALGGIGALLRYRARLGA